MSATQTAGLDADERHAPPDEQRAERAGVHGGDILRPR